MKPTDEQLAIAESTSDRLLVRALAGTGKTETVSLRARNLNDSGKTAVLTFTKTARETIKRRLRQHKIKDVEVSTVHGLAYKLVSEYFGREVKITDGESELQAALGRLGLATTKGSVDNLRRAAVAEWNGLTPMIASTTHGRDRLYTLLKGYRDAKREAGTLDFDDLVVLASRLASGNFDHLIVDEAQDSSAVQMALIRRLSAGSLTLVGDPNQVIYEFAGVNPQVLDLEEEWTTLSLTRSFRSTSEILKLPNQLLEGEQITTELHGGTVLISTEEPDFENSPQGLPNAILARSRKELEPYAEQFRDLGLSVRTSWDVLKFGKPDITLSTVHASKGAEWSHVALIGMTNRGFAGCDMTESEKRLMYVALTRAKNRMDLYFLPGGDEINPSEYYALPWGMRL